MRTEKVLDIGTSKFVEKFCGESVFRIRWKFQVLAASFGGFGIPFVFDSQFEIRIQIDAGRNLFRPHTIFTAEVIDILRKIAEKNFWTVNNPAGNGEPLPGI